MKRVSRRHFLQIAGAASALSVAPHLLGRTQVARAQAGLIGRAVVFNAGPVTVHSYVAPDASFQVTSHIFETPNSLVVIDAQLAQTFASEFKAYADGLGKPIDRVILSHEHPDHYLGGTVFADVPFVTTDTIAANVQTAIEGGSRENMIAILGESEVAAELRAPEGGLTAGELVIDGVTFALDVYNNAEAPETLVVRLPEAGVVVVQDLLYSNAHFFPGLDRANWISILDGLRTSLTEGGYSVVLPGHGLPAGKGALDTAIEYLTFANETAATAASADEIVAALQARYPTYDVAGILAFWPQFFQPA